MYKYQVAVSMGKQIGKISKRGVHGAYKKRGQCIGLSFYSGDLTQWYAVMLVFCIGRREDVAKFRVEEIG
mgnify:CR=1 FL=1